MKFIFFLLITTCLYVQAKSIDIENIKYFASNDGNESRDDGDIVAYTLKSDPCLMVKSEKYGELRYCRISDEINLEIDQKITYIMFNGPTLHFSIINKKNRYSCFIILGTEKTNCRATNEKSLYK